MLTRLPREDAETPLGAEEEEEEELRAGRSADPDAAEAALAAEEEWEDGDGADCEEGLVFGLSMIITSSSSSSSSPALTAAPLLILSPSLPFCPRPVSVPADALVRLLMSLLSSAVLTRVLRVLVWLPELGSAGQDKLSARSASALLISLPSPSPIVAAWSLGGGLVPGLDPTIGLCCCCRRRRCC